VIRGHGLAQAQSLPSIAGIQSDKIEAFRCRKLNGGFDRFLRPVWSTRSDGNGSGSVLHLTALNGGSTNHTGRLRSDDRCMSASGRPHRQGEGL
jgi:hypothetical protein